MMKYIISLLSILIYTCLFSQTPQQFTMWDNAIGGLNTTKLPQNLNPYQFQELNNVYTDDDNGIKQSEGIFTIWSATDNIRFHKEYTKTDGSRYLIFVASNTLNYANTGGAYTTLLATVTLTGTIWGSQYNNRFYIGDSDGDAWYFDGTTLVVSSQIPQGKYATVAYGILFIANQTNLNSKVSYSMIDDFQTFDSLFYFLINKDDGEDITGMFQFRGDIYIAKRHSLHKLLNISDNTNIGDDWITISKEIGCIDNKSIQELNNAVYWLSENGIIKFDGTGFTLLSTDIKPTISNISETKSGIKYDVITTSVDFNTGTFDSYITTVTNNSILVSTTANVQMSTGTTFHSRYPALIHKLYQTLTPSATGYLGKVFVSLHHNQGFTDMVGVGIRGGDLTNGTTLWQYITTTQMYTFDFSTQTVTLSKDRVYQLFLTTSSLVVGTGIRGDVYWDDTDGNTYNGGSVFVDGVAVSTTDFVFKVEITTPTLYYYSPIRNLNNNQTTWRQWQTFDYTSTNDNDTLYFIKTSTSLSNLVQHPWVNVTDNAVISSTMGAFFQWYAQINSTNTNYSLNDVTVSYYASNPSNTLSSGIDIANQRYLLGYTELPSTIPNKVLVWQDRNKSFTMLSGFNPTTMGYYKNDFYIGTLQGKINRFSYDYTDYNGVSINPYFKTGDFDFNARIMDKYSKELWLSAEPSVLYTTATVDVFLNRSTWAVVSFDYSLVADPYAPNNAIDKKIYKYIGRFTNIAFKIANFVTFNGLDLIYTTEPRK